MSLCWVQVTFTPDYSKTKTVAAGKGFSETTKCTLTVVDEHKNKVRPSCYSARNQFAPAAHAHLHMHHFSLLMPRRPRPRQRTRTHPRAHAHPLMHACQ